MQREFTNLSMRNTSIRESKTLDEFQQVKKKKKIKNLDDENKCICPQ